MKIIWRSAVKSRSVGIQGDREPFNHLREWSVWACLMFAFSITPAFSEPLTGRWRLNVGRSHYGPGAQLRKDETFECEPAGLLLRCTVRSHRADGRYLVGSFTAGLDGMTYSATGIPDVDQVSLRTVAEFVADATFSYLDRKVLSSLVVYDRQ